MKYAGQKKVAKGIAKRLKAEQSAKKSNDKKSETKKIHYYANLTKNNK